MLRLRQFVDCTPDTVPDGLSIMLLIQTGREMLPTPQFRSSRTTLSGVLRIRQVLLPPCFMPQKCSNPLLCPCCGCCRGLLYEEPYVWSPRVRLLIVSNPLLCPCCGCCRGLLYEEPYIWSPRVRVLIVSCAALMFVAALRGAKNGRSRHVRVLIFSCVLMFVAALRGTKNGRSRHVRVLIFSCVLMFVAALRGTKNGRSRHVRVLIFSCVLMFMAASSLVRYWNT